MGSNLNEGQLFGWLWGTPRITPAELRNALGFVVDAKKVDSIAARYPIDADAPTVFIHVLDDVITCMARQTARGLAAAGAPTYLYEFTYPYTVAAVPNVVATHRYELPFVFRNGYAGAAMSDDDLIVADNVDGYWFSLGKSGDPNAARAKGTVVWPQYSATRDEHVVLDKTTSVGKGLKSETCDFWDGLLK